MTTTTELQPTDDQTSEEIRVYEHYATLPQRQCDDEEEATLTKTLPQMTTTNRPIKRQRSKRRRAKLLRADNRGMMGKTGGRVASEAEDLANDSFFYEKLAKEDPNSAAGDPDGKDVEFVEPVNTGKAKGVDTGVVILQGRKGAGGVQLGSEDESIPDKYSETDSDGYGAVAEQEEDEEEVGYRSRVVDDDKEQEEDTGDYGAGDRPLYWKHNKQNGNNGENDKEEPQSKSRHFTREFDSTADLLKEVQDIVRKNEKLTKNSNDDVYWEVKYEHPQFD